MKSRGQGMLLILLVSLLEFVRVSGEEYSAIVSPTEEVDDNGVCRKMVTVSGHGIKDTIPVVCKMTSYMVTNAEQLVVGDKMYSDEENTLMVLGPSGCERRTYKDGKLDNVKDLTDDKCEDVKLSIMRAYMKSTGQDDDWTLSSSDETDETLSESQIKAYDELRDWVAENLKSDSRSRSKELSKELSKEQSKEDSSTSTFW